MSDPDDSGQRKRQQERVTINKAFDSLDSFISEYVANISRSGVFIASREPLPVGTSVDLSFTVFIDGMHTIEGIGEVVRVDHDPPGMGVVFTELSSASEEILTRLLTRQKPSPQPSGDD